MKKQLSLLKENYILILSALLGAVVFLSIFGYRILNPSNIQWLMQGDEGTHFIGWHFFRSEPWHFPLGVIKSYMYPQGTSIVYTDSIPLMAIPLKFFSAILPPVFQYRGIWLLLCYILQGLFAALLLRTVIKQPFLVLTGALFFLLSPVMFERSGYHESLVAHWLILAALYLYFQDYSHNTKIKWFFLLLLAITVHFYLFIMVVIILLAYFLKLLLIDHKKYIFDFIIFATFSLMSVFFIMWSIGYFIIEVSTSSTTGLGDYSMNLLAPFNPAPNNMTTFLNPVPLAAIGQYEGFNYLGLGLILLLIFSACVYFRNKISFVWSRDFPLLLISFFLFMLSLSNKITVADTVLLEMKFPYIVNKLLSVIRASGRMFWPVFYILMLAAISIVVKYISFKKAVLALLLFLSIQTIDFLPWYYNTNIENSNWNNSLTSPLWDKLIKEVNHIVFIPAVRQSDDYLSFALLAVKHGKTINVGYVARIDAEERRKYIQDSLREFKEGKIRSDSLYVINPSKRNKSTSCLLSILKGHNISKAELSTNFIQGILNGYQIIAPAIELTES